MDAVVVCDVVAGVCVCGGRLNLLFGGSETNK